MREPRAGFVIPSITRNHQHGITPPPLEVILFMSRGLSPADAPRATFLLVANLRFEIRATLGAHRAVGGQRVLRQRVDPRRQRGLRRELTRNRKGHTYEGYGNHSLCP